MPTDEFVDWLKPDEMPASGSEVAVSIAQSATRTSLFPDQAVVASTPEFMEFIFLRNNPVALRQTVEIVNSNGVSVEVRVKNTDVKPRLTDIGHVRLGLSPAVELAFAVVKHALDQGAVSAPDLRKRLNSVLKSAK